MVNKFNSFSQSKITKFIKDNETIQESNYSTIGKSNVYTNGNSITAYLPIDDFYNILPGSLITANNKTRYILTKNSIDKSVILDSEVNWKNRGQGFPFTYQNPISQILDNSKNIIGYITRDHQLYLIDNLPGLQIDQLNCSSTSTGLKLLNSNNYGIYITNDGNVYIGNDNTNTWKELGSLTSGDSDLSNCVLKTDTDVSTNLWVLDENTLLSNSNTKVATQRSIKYYIDNKVIDGGLF